MEYMKCMKYMKCKFHYRYCLKGFINGVWAVKKIQSLFRRFIAIKKVNIMRCIPENLFDTEFGKQRMIILKISNHWTKLN